MDLLLGMNFNDVSGTSSLSTFLADPLERNTDYKKKGNGIGDKRALRLHRRSVNQRKMRDAALVRQRGIDAMSPLKEVQNVTENKAPLQVSQKKTTSVSSRSARPQSQSSDMKDRLKKWKEEKELKKKLQRQKQGAKPMFKVHHVQYEKPPFTVTKDKKTSKAKPATATVSRVTRSSARINNKPTTAPVISTRQTRVRQKEQPASTTTTRATRMTRRTASQSSSSEQVKPVRRSTRTTRASARAAQKQKDETKPTTKRTTSRTLKKQQEEKVEEPEPPQTENLFSQTTINFERGEQSTSLFLQGPSFAPVDFKFDFTIDFTKDAPKTPDRRCSSTPLHSSKTKIPTPQGVSTIRKSGAKPVAPINVPVLSLSSSTSMGPVTPALTSETNAIPQKSMEASAESRGSSAEEGDIGQVDMETDESAGKKDGDVAESKAPIVEMSEAPTTTNEMEIQAEVMETEKAEGTEERKTPEVVDETEVPVEIVMEEAKLESAAQPEPQEPAEVTSETEEKKAKSAEQPEPQDTAEESAEIVMEEEKPKSMEQPEIQTDEIPVENVSTATSEVTIDANQETATETKEDSAAGEAKEEEKDVPYFRSLVVSQTSRLMVMCQKWQSVMDESSLTEEVLGEIRSTIGKAQLLMAQRFKQFVGLVDDCEFDRGEKKTHCSDLIGFWEMVAYQVENVDKMFADLDKLKANNWFKEVKIIKPKVKKVVKKSKASAASKKAAADRVAARQRLLAARAAMKAKATRSKDNEKVVFEGGFFKVESPVKSPKVHCAAGSPLGAAFLRRTNNTPGSRQGSPLLRRTGTTPGSKPGSRQGTPRPQTFIPSKPRLSLQLQAALCTPISKLVLTKADEKAPSPARSTRSRQGTPVGVVKPMNVSRIPPLATSPVNEASSMPLARTPVATKHRESVAHPLIPGIASPHITADSNSNKMFEAAPSIFTPPQKTAPTTSTSPVPTVNDLICLDSPTLSSLAPPLPLQTSAQDPTGSVQCFAAINASTDMKDLLGTDVVMSPVRRSARHRHASNQMTVDRLAEMPEDVDYGYQPNVSLL